MPVSINSINNSSFGLNDLSLPDLIDQAKAGQQNAYTLIYNNYFEKLYQFIYYRVNHRETAEDLTEEVFIKAFQNLPRLENHLSFTGWLYQIARNQVIDYYRSKKTTLPLTEIEQLVEYGQNIIDLLNTTSDQKLLLQAIKQLPKDYQQIIQLKFFEDLSNQQIAAMLNKNQGTIRVLQHRALTRLKTIITSLTPT